MLKQTLAEKIISAHTPAPVRAGDFVVADVDVTAVQDGTGPLTVAELEKAGFTTVKNPARTILFIDHAAPSPRKELSNTHLVLREMQRLTPRSTAPTRHQSHPACACAASKPWPGAERGASSPPTSPIKGGKVARSLGGRLLQLRGTKGCGCSVLCRELHGV